MRVHVTGGSGFLGTSVIPKLLAERYEVTALARSEAAATQVGRLGAEAIIGDLDDPTSIRTAFAKSEADALVNLASLGFGHAPTIVAAAEQCGITRAVFVSTTSIFTRISTSSKPVRLLAEKCVKESKLDWTIVRPTMIYGKLGDRNMARLLRAVSRLPIFPLPGGGRGLQQPVHVDDLATAIVNALSRPATVHNSYNLAGPGPLTLRAVIEEAGRAVERHPMLIPMPLQPLVGVARLYEAVSTSPRLKAEQLARLAEDKAFDIGPARADLDYNPRSFAEGIRGEAALLK